MNRRPIKHERPNGQVILFDDSSNRRVNDMQLAELLDIEKKYTDFVSGREIDIQTVKDAHIPVVGGIGEDYLPCKEAISIQPGDVVNIVHEKPEESIAFTIFKRISNQITLPAGGCTLEVYREKGKLADEPEYYCTNLKRKCWGSCEINPNSVHCSHREQVESKIPNCPDPPPPPPENVDRKGVY